MTPPGAGENGITPEPPKSPRRLRAVEPAEASFERISSVFGSAPRYELEFGKQSPLALTMETGASEFDPDLGGVHLQRPTVRHGADKFELGFSEPNPEPMELLEVSSGAARIELENLANANFSEMHLRGAASYDLDFGGALSRDARVSIETGLSGSRDLRTGLDGGEDRGRVHPKVVNREVTPSAYEQGW